MTGYQLTIKNTEETIELSTKEKKDSPDITGVHFKMNTIEENTKNRADSVRGELIITGNITSENRDVTKRLAKWSMDSNKKTQYRDIELVVYVGENCSGDVLRRYAMDSMFVIDYDESFGEHENKSSESGTFTLFIAQKDGNYKKEVFSS